LGGNTNIFVPVFKNTGAFFCTRRFFNVTMLQQCTPKDATALATLLHQAYQADLDLGIHFKAATVTPDQVAQHLATTPTFIWKQGGQIASTVSVRLPWSANPGPYNLPHLGWVATAPNFARQGLAQQLIAQVEQIYIQNVLHAPAITLGTAVEHPWLQQTYEKLGYQPFQRLQKFPDHHTVYLIKVLNQPALAQVPDQKLQSQLSQQFRKEVQHEI
jgi:GNAT superfamily N-acetyltransferase